MGKKPGRTKTQDLTSIGHDFHLRQCSANVFAADSSLDFHLLPLLVGHTSPSPAPPGHAHIPKGMDDHTQERRQGEQTVDGSRDGVAVDMLLSQTE